MTENKRIFWNFMATYGRSVFALFLGLFSARWVLMALGKSDFGLFGVVGCIVVLVSFLNDILSGALGRFYAFAIGEARRMSPGEGVDHVAKWFNAAVSIHFILPLVLVVVGYPIGLYAINHWLVIPGDRLNACVVVFRCALAGSFIQMITVPYTSIYRAKQLISELMIWEMLKTLLTFLGAFGLLFWTRDRLIAYAALMAFAPGLIVVILSIKARRNFPECRIAVKYLFDLRRLRQIFSFAFWEIFASGGGMIRLQGTAFLINRNFGSVANASWTIGNSVSNHTTALSTAMLNAVTPALTTAVGAGNYDRANRLAFACSKFGPIFIMLFAVPLILEMDYVLKLWLVNPPEYSNVFCSCMLLALIVHKLGWGHHMAILAYGKIRGLDFYMGMISSLTVIMVWWMIHAGFGAMGVGCSFIISFGVLTILRVVIANKVCSMSARFWVLHVVVPIVLVGVITFFCGKIPSAMLEPSFCRLVLTSIVSFIVLVIASFLIAFNNAERQFIAAKIRRLFEVGLANVDNGRDEVGI